MSQPCRASKIRFDGSKVGAWKLANKQNERRKAHPLIGAPVTLINLEIEPAVRVLQQLLPARTASQFLLRLVPRPPTGDYYQVTGHDGMITVKGTSPAVLLTGVHSYLKRVAQVSINWNGGSLERLPSVLPAPSVAITDEAVVPHRYVGNETWTGYTDAYWGFEDWRSEIDLLAMNGVNEVLILTGQVSVYYETFKTLGYADDELREWLPPPAHQPWFHLQSMHTIAPIPKSILEAQADLACQVIKYMRSLGIVPVFPGYSGMVPPGFADRNPGATVTPQGNYGPYERVDQLDPTDKRFSAIAQTFYEAQSQMFGDTTMYNMNILHESGNPGDTPLPHQAAAIERALQSAHPGAIWVMLGWWHNPLRVVLDSLDKRRVLVLDGMADISRVDPDKEFGGAPYAFGSIWNFGGRTYMRGRLETWVNKFHTWRNRPNSRLSGIAVLPEGNDTNPAAFALLTELAWRSGPVDFSKWLEEFATYRYGIDDSRAKAAWRGLGETVFSSETPPLGPVCLERSDPFATAPDISSSLLTLHPTHYDPQFDTILADLLQMTPVAQHTSAYRYDLLDVARQALANHAYRLHAKMRASYRAGRLDEFILTSKKWLYWMKLMDKLLATNKQTLLGSYVENAERWGMTAAETAIARYDALSIITVWAEEPGLDDYGGRAWAGLMGGYYYDRWATYLHEITDAMKNSRAPKEFDWHVWGDDWLRSDHPLATVPAGDVVSIARQVYEEITA